MSKRERDSSFNKDNCLAFVASLWELDSLGMFHHPVSSKEHPDYHKMIKRPVDLSTIRDNIGKGKYNSDVDVQNDVARMIGNALEYNKKGSPWHKQAMSFYKVYLDLAGQAGLTLDDDEAYIPSCGFKDDESTLRRAEKRHKEDLEEVLRGLETEREVPLEVLRSKYQRDQKEAKEQETDDCTGSSTQGCDDEEDDEEYDDDSDESEECEEESDDYSS